MLSLPLDRPGMNGPAGSRVESDDTLGAATSMPSCANIATSAWQASLLPGPISRGGVVAPARPVHDGGRARGPGGRMTSTNWRIK